MKSLLPILIFCAVVTLDVTAQVANADASMEKAMAIFPDIGHEGTPLFIAIERKIAEIKTTNPAAFNNPEWPLVMAINEAVRLGIRPVLPEVATAAAPAQPDRLRPINALSPPADVAASQQAKQSQELARLRDRRAAQAEARAAAAKAFQMERLVNAVENIDANTR